MVVSTETPSQAEVIFVIETTSANLAYIDELKTNYLVPTLEYFHGGPLEEGGGNGSVYGIVTYQAADCYPGQPVATHGPFNTPQDVIETVDKLQFVGGRAETRACVVEALTMALSCLDELGRAEAPTFVILFCCSPPYAAYGGGLVPPGCPATPEACGRLFSERGVQLSVVCPRRVVALSQLYEQAGGELHAAQQRNYAKDPRDLVLLRGFSLKERPPSPAPPPAPEIQPDFGPPRGPPRGAPPAGFPRARGWLSPARQNLYANNSALLSQLAQPSYPPPQQPGLQRMPGMMGAGAAVPPPSANPSINAPGPSGVQAPGQPPQRTYIWSGILEWLEKGKGPGDQQKVTKLLPCQVSSNYKELEPELKVDSWPNKLLMQLMPKQLISNIGGVHLKDSKSVLFHLQQNEAVESLTKVMVNGFAGCVHFSPVSSTPQCDIRVLILLYTPEKKAFLGFIPKDQVTFVDRLRKVIQQQKITQMISKQLPQSVGGGLGNPNMAAAGNMAATGMPGPSGMSPAGMSSAGMHAGMGGMGGVGGVGGVGVGQMPNQNMVQSNQMQHQQGMMIQNNMQPQQVQQVGNVGGKGHGVTQLDGLEAARQQNLEKILQLQQTLNAAHQQEAHFKSQMDIMSHLQAAQQQEQNYKQLELQQQLQQQLRAAGPRVMRPIMPANPGLKHLLQQQPQYRPGAGPARPPSQPQQFEEVPNYDFL